MAEMSEELMDLINGVPCCYWATASKGGIPNVAAAGSTAAVSADTIITGVFFLGKTLENLKENPKAMVLVHSAAPPKAEFSMETLAPVTGAQIRGSVTLQSSGDLHEQMKNIAAQALGAEAAGLVKTTLVLKVEEIYSVKALEPGKKIA